MKPEDSHCKALVMFQRPKGLQGIQDFFFEGRGGGKHCIQGEQGNRRTREQENGRRREWGNGGTGELENGRTIEREKGRTGK